MASHSMFHSQTDKSLAQGQEVTSVNLLIFFVGGNYEVKKFQKKANLKIKKKKKTG